MKYIYEVRDKRTNEVLYSSSEVNDCLRYIDAKCCVFSTVLRKRKVTKKGC